MGRGREHQGEQRSLSTFPDGKCKGEEASRAIGWKRPCFSDVDAGARLGRDGCLSSSAYAQRSPKPAGLLVMLDRGVTHLSKAFMRFGGVSVCATGTREMKRSGEVAFCPLQT